MDLWDQAERTPSSLVYDSLSSFTLEEQRVYANIDVDWSVTPARVLCRWDADYDLNELVDRDSDFSTWSKEDNANRESNFARLAEHLNRALERKFNGVAEQATASFEMNTTRMLANGLRRHGMRLSGDELRSLFTFSHRFEAMTPFTRKEVQKEYEDWLRAAQP